MLIVYTGNQLRYTVKKPVAYSFVKNVPIMIPDHLASNLDANLFEVYDDKKDYGEIPESKILITMPFELGDFLCTVNIINRIKAIYPKCNISIHTNPGFVSLLPDGIEFIGKINVGTVNTEYYKHFRLLRHENRDIFNSVQLNAHSLEKLFLMGSSVYEPVNDKELTTTPYKGKNEKPTHIMLIKRGLTIGDTWKELANHLEKRFNKDNIRLHVIDGYDDKMIGDYVKQFGESGYCISCGDSPLNWLCLYSNVPLFTFLPESIKQIKIKQYDYFDNFIYSHIGITDNLESIYLTLKNNIGEIYAEKKAINKEQVKPVQRRPRDKDRSEPRATNNDIEKENSTDTTRRLGDNGYRRNRKRTVTVGN